MKSGYTSIIEILYKNELVGFMILNRIKANGYAVLDYLAILPVSTCTRRVSLNETTLSVLTLGAMRVFLSMSAESRLTRQSIAYTLPTTMIISSL